MSQNTYDILIMLGRPASGKSEIINYLTHIAPDERLGRYHLADLDVLDDFPMLWTWFEEDHILGEVFGLPGLHTDSQGCFLKKEYWHLLVERLSLEYAKRLREADYHEKQTCLIEFSRGSEHGGYEQAFLHLSDEILRRAAFLYVNVSFEESLRKNRRRYNPDRPDSILEHGLSDSKLERLYKEDDWHNLVNGTDGFLEVRGFRVPYVLFENMDDVTTGQPDKLAARLEETLNNLWKLYPRR
ncbi:MAG: hypothetical protein JXA13_12025 [Anaerolineales bacterium]|nr:hypothetical protein [Anaerolineales bacterium]